MWLSQRLFSLIDHVPARLTAFGFRVVGKLPGRGRRLEARRRSVEARQRRHHPRRRGGRRRRAAGRQCAPGVTPDRSKTFSAGEGAAADAEGSTPGLPPQLGHLGIIVGLVWALGGAVDAAGAAAQGREPDGLSAVPPSPRTRPLQRRIPHEASRIRGRARARRCPAARAQLADKPSAYTAARRGQPMPAATAARHAPAFLDRIADRAAFASLARVYEPGTPYAIEHLLFAIEPGRGRKPDRVFFINTQRYGPARGLPARAVPRRQPRPRRGAQALHRARPPLHPRHAGWHAESKRWLYEFWEGDAITPALLKTAQADLAGALLRAARPQDQLRGAGGHAQAAGIAAVTEAQILGARDYMALNRASRAGGCASSTTSSPRRWKTSCRPTSSSCARCRWRCRRGRRRDGAAVDGALARQPAGQGLGRAQRVRARRGHPSARPRRQVGAPRGHPHRLGRRRAARARDRRPRAPRPRA